MPRSRSRRTSTSRFSSTFASTRSGASSAIRAQSGFFVPRTRATPTSASAGWMHQSVTPTTRSPRPSAKSVSVTLGTSDTIRSARSGSATSTPDASTQRSPGRRASTRASLAARALAPKRARLDAASHRLTTGKETAMAQARGHEERLQQLGIELPKPSRPVANYLSCKRSGDLLWVGGHGPVAPQGIVQGKVGGSLTLDEGKEAARLTALSILATVRAELG